MVMIKNYDDFFNDDLQLSESELKVVNDAAEMIAEKLNNGEEIDEGLFGSIVGGITGATIGPAIGRAICQALGITSGMLYNFLTSRAFTSAVAAYIGYKN